MVHWRGFGHDFKTHLLEVLNRPTSGLLDCFSQWKTRLTTASQAVCNILRGETAFRQDEDNVESFSSSGSVMLLPVSTPGLVQRTPLGYRILLKCNYSQTHRYTGIPMIFFQNSISL